VQRKTAPPALSIVSWIATRIPNHGCQKYSSSRKAVPWAFSSLVVQHHQAAQRSRQSAASRICQTLRSRNATGRDAALHRGLRAPSRCTTEPTGLK
jgi:hypothetical protein